MKKRDRILIIDDIELNRILLGEIFSDTYEIVEADSGKHALEYLRRDVSFCVILLDLVMPDFSGYDVLNHLAAHGLLGKIPVVVVTADDNEESEAQALDQGASDLITKPFVPHLVKRRVSNIIDLYRHKNRLENLVAIQSQKLQETNELMIDALSSMIEYRNWESGKHVHRIRTFTKALLDQVIQTPYGSQWDQRSAKIIANASSMHDIGKISIPDDILSKPGPLTPQEFEIMKTHCIRGSEMIRKFSWIEDREYLLYAYEICRYHHERWDGNGYPDGLSGREIPPCALVVSVADVYDALTSNRVYKAATSHKEAIRMIVTGECGLYPTWLLECLEKVQDSFEATATQYAHLEQHLFCNDILV